jgi:phage baseplate assembly protein W
MATSNIGQNQYGLVQSQPLNTNAYLGAPPYFVGFNTIGKTTSPYSLTDIELVKRDILNQFQTPIGSRVMLPTFGSNIYTYLFDPFDEITQNAIVQDATNVVNSDPRVNLVSIDVFSENQAITVAMVLQFQPSGVVDNLFVTFTQQDSESY